MNAKKGYDQSKVAAADAERQIESNALRQYSQLQVRQEQETARAAQAISASAVAARSAKASAAVASGESGVGGNSVAALQQEFERTATNYEGAVIRNKAFLDANFKEQAETVRLGAEADLNRVANQVQAPNYLGIILGAAGDALKIKAKQNADSPIETASAGAPSYDSSPNYYPDID